MPVSSVKNPQLRSLADDLVRRSASQPVAMDGKTVGALVAALGVDGQPSSVLDQLKGGSLPPDQMLQVAKAAVQKHPQGEDDLKALLADPSFSKLLDPTSSNFLKAVVGLEPLRAGGSFGGAPVGQIGQANQNAEAAAVSKMKEWIKSGTLQRYYDAAIGIGDASLKDEAMRVFSALPKITPDATATDFVKAGIWAAPPKGIEEMQKSARYLPGRQLLVETNINANTGDYYGFLSYKADGPKGLTYRATMVGEKGDNFLVKVDGSDQPIEVSKKRVYELNQPHVYSGDTIKIGWDTVDYNDPFTKAKITEAAVKMADEVAKLDFTKMKTSPTGGIVGAIFGRGQQAEEMTQVQRKCVREVHDVINMKYTTSAAMKEPGRASSGSVGRQAVKGVGVCYDQATVMLALLLPFRNVVGFDAQFISGGVYRNTKRNDPPEQQFRSFTGQAHGWLQLTYRPKMETRIVDRTWSQPDHPMDRAYSVGGDRYPTTHYSGVQVQPLADTDVNFTGSVSVQTYDRQFGEVGRDGRENHMSSWQDQ